MHGTSTKPAIGSQASPSIFFRARAEAWTRAHEVFTRVNFNAFDYNTIKESLLDYVKLYFPEDFNDYIESSEFIAILEIFAYVGEILAYRLDLNAHENFITTAERKESILRLAKLISYKASRNIAARGLVKITSIQTTEQVVDSQGRNLSNTNIVWNDLNNVDWKEQFLVVMNRVLEQDFGTIAPNERAQIEDVLFELYTWGNQPLKSNGITTFDYSATSAGTSFPMELVPVKLTETSPVEKRPERNGKMSLLYGSDGLGDGSDTTGFFLFTKQGTLQVQQKSFDGVTPNQTSELVFDNINETDIWLNNVDTDTRGILEVDPYAEILPHLADKSNRYGEWDEVDLANAQNILFNTDKNRQKYETETLDRDQVRLIFGDGEFSDIPSGEFDIWYRTSANSSSIIQQTSVIDQTASFTYLDLTNTVQTFTFTFSLINSLQNASVSEDIEHVRRVAPSVYYTQDRMVNGRDYNSFMLQDPSILKLQAVNRTFSGDSKYIAWHDPKEYYEDVKIFGEDLALYWVQNDVTTGGLLSSNRALTSNEVIVNLVEPLLCSADFYNIMVDEFQKATSTSINDLRCTFSVAESASIQPDLDLAATSANPQVDLYFSAEVNEWTVDAHPTESSIFMIRIEAQFSASSLSGWTVRWQTKRMNVQSETTRFRHSNTTTSIINFSTLNSNDDNVLILRANLDGNKTGMLSANKKYNVLGQELVEQNLPNAGIPDDNKLSVLPTDLDDDGVADFEPQEELFDATDTFIVTGSPAQEISFILPSMYYTHGFEAESVIVTVDGTPYQYDQTATIPESWRTPSTGSPETFENELTSIIINDSIVPGGSPEVVVEITTKQYVYFTRATSTDAWVPIEDTTLNKAAWYSDQTNTINLYKREYGRYPLNFAWFYTTPRFHLVDPAASNIIDMFLVTAGYYQGLTRWLENKTDVKPDEPTPLDLRTAYDSLLQNSMISDTVILQSGKFKILFGSRAIPELRAKFKVIRPTNNNLTDNEVKVNIVGIIQSFFDIDDWDFGSSFFFTELAASVHASLGTEINSIVLVPSYTTNQFGDMFQVQSRENEIFIPDISTENIEIIQSFTSENIRQ